MAHRLREEPAFPLRESGETLREELDDLARALKAKQYDLVSVQVHYGSTVAEDVAVLSEFVRMQPKAVFVIHSGWARAASRAEEYSAKSADGKMQHSPAYLDAVLAKLRELHPGRIFRQTRAQDLLARVADDIAAKKAPFSPARGPLPRRHPPERRHGRYLMHNAMRHALGQPRSVAGFETIPSPVKTYLDAVLDTLPPPATEP